MVDKLTDDQARLLGLAEHLGPPMSDQEVRARALECAVRGDASLRLDMANWEDMEKIDRFWALVDKFEDYIRNGK